MKIWYQSFVDFENGAAYWETLGSYLDSVKAPGTQIDIKGITPFDSYAHPLVEFRCAREVICNAVRAEREGYDAFVIGHFQDSGLYEARAAVDIPVVSLGEASMLYGCQMGQRMALVSINPRFIPGHLHQISKYGLKDRVPQVHAMTFEPGQILEAYHSGKKRDAVLALFEEQARPLVAAGCDVLIPAGGIPMLLFSQVRDHKVGAVPVLNGIPIVLKMAEMAASLRALTGQTASRAGDFVKPPEHVIEEFLTHPKGL